MSKSKYSSETTKFDLCNDTDPLYGQDGRGGSYADDNEWTKEAHAENVEVVATVCPDVRVPGGGAADPA